LLNSVVNHSSLVYVLDYLLFVVVFISFFGDFNHKEIVDLVGFGADLFSHIFFFSYSHVGLSYTNCWHYLLVDLYRGSSDVHCWRHLVADLGLHVGLLFELGKESLLINSFDNVL
jgi:hypothetical protein